MINKSFDLNNNQKNFSTISQPITPLHENISTQNFTNKSRDQSIESGEDTVQISSFEQKPSAL
mgnify:CR=1 FL=1